MKTGKKKTLAGKIIIGTNLPFILIIAVMGIISTIQLERVLTGMTERNRENSLEYSVRLLQENIDNTVKNHLRTIAEKNRDLIALYDQRARRGEITDEEARREARRVMLDPEYGKIGTTGYLAGVNTAGILAIHPLSEGADASGHEFMKQAMAMKNGYLEYEWQNPGEKAPRTKAGYLSYYEPWDIMVWASSYKEEFETLLDPVHIREMIESLRVGTDGFLMLIDSSGRILAGGSRFDSLFSQSDGSREKALSALSAAASAAASEAASVGTSAEEPAAGYRYDSDQGPVEGLVSGLPEIGWTLAVNDFSREYLQIIRTFRLMVIMTILTASVIVSILIRILMRKTLAPMRLISSVSTLVSGGDLSSRIPFESSDEMGELARFFNSIVDSFAGLVKDIGKATEVLLEETHSLGAGAREVSSTANQQAAAVKEILSTMEDSDKLSKGVAVRIQEVVKIANSTRETVEKGFALIKESLEKMSKIRETNGGTIGGIKVLGGQIDSIWEIVNIINGIADQTKIIAFNAELEAASAGEAGKNFQIVAGEIRRLADSTVESTNEIKTKINEIQHASDKLIIASEEGTQRIKEGWEVSHKIQGVFEEVLSSSEISAASAEDIARSIRMQVSSFEQIFLTLKQISEGINNFVESTGGTSDSSDRLKDIADQFRVSIGRYTIDSSREDTEREGEDQNG